jgi:predicted metal-dependent phosphoesterase TrpH
MTRDEVLARLTAERATFDAKVAAVPLDALETPVPGSTHSVKDIVAHVTAYEQLIVERLVAARHGAMTAFERDRAGWEVFNERTWREASGKQAKAVLAHSAEVFASLRREIAALSDAELAAPTGATAALDPAWLDGEAPWRMIEIDALGHYPMHYPALDAVRGG